MMDYLTFSMMPMCVFMMVVMFVLYVLLAPGLLLRIPSNGSKLTVAIVHGIVFVFLTHLVCYLYCCSMPMNNMKNMKNMMM